MPPAYRRETRWPWRAGCQLDAATGRRIDDACQRYRMSRGAVLRAAVAAGLGPALAALRKRAARRAARGREEQHD